MLSKMCVAKICSHIIYGHVASHAVVYLRVYVSITFSGSPKSSSAVGFIGLGNMGRGMAKNLLEKGNSVVAFDMNAGTLAEAVKIGAVAAGGPKEVAHFYSLYLGTWSPKACHYPRIGLTMP